MPRTKSDYMAAVQGWVSGKAKAPATPRSPKRAKLIQKRGDLPQFQKSFKGSAF